MTRREMLAAVSASGLTSCVTLACGPADTRFLELRISPISGESPFTVEEFLAERKSAGVVRCDDERGLALFLSRTMKDPTAPRQVQFAVADGNSLERIWSAVRVVRGAGIAQVRYFGCIPPGCGIRTGATADQQRHAGTALTTEWLDKTLETHSTFC